MRLSLMPLLPFTIVFILGILLEGWGVGAWFMVVPLIGAIILWLFRQPYGVLMCCGVTANDLKTVGAYKALPYDSHTPQRLIIVNLVRQIQSGNRRLK